MENELENLHWLFSFDRVPGPHGGPLAQSSMMQGSMWDGGWMGGYVGPWGAICLVAVIAILAVWIIVQRKGK